MSEEENKPGETKPEAAEPAEAASPRPAGEPPEGGAPASSERRPLTEEEKAARRQAAAERAAARAGSARGAAPGAAAGEAGGPEAPPKPPSPNQPLLDRAVQLLREQVAEDAVVEAWINEPNDHLPTLVLKGEYWPQAARLFRDHAEFGCRYLRNMAGVDCETHMEVVYHLLNMDTGRNYCVKIRTDRDRPSVPSATPVWETANWNEREIYDLLGVDFPGHPDLRRIMMPDDWVGHPLRKDYVPLDPEV